MNNIKLNESWVEGHYFPSYNFSCGNGYLLFSPVRDFYQKIILNRADIIDGQDIIFTDNFPLYDLYEKISVKDFLKFDKKNIISIWQEVSNLIKENLTFKVSVLSGLEKKIVTLIYLLNKYPTQVFFTTIDGLTPKSELFFCQFVKHIVAIQQDTCIIIIRDYLNTKEFQVLNVNDKLPNSLEAYEQFMSRFW